jgi:acyl carrier protein/GNAT superfamily N-acetyltransferase
MKNVSNIAEVFRAVAEIKKESRGAWITNLYPEEKKLQYWIDQQIFYVEHTPHTIFFLRKDQDFYHLYFYSESYLCLASSLEAINNSDILVADCIGSKNEMEPVIDAFICAKYHLYTSFDRMKKIVSEDEYKEISGVITLPGISEAGIIFTMLENAFDRFAEQLPSEAELKTIIKNQQALIIREGNDIAGILIRKKTGKSATLQHFLVAERYRGNKLGSRLLKYFINECMGGVITLWVLSSNKNAIEVYKHLGFTVDSMNNLVFINKTICYSDMRQKILNILRGIRPEFNFEEIKDFNEEGALDSFDIVQLTVELEKEFDVNIDGMDIVKESFKNIESIVDLLHKSGALPK